jgi:hypothetical protein
VGLDAEVRRLTHATRPRDTLSQALLIRRLLPGASHSGAYAIRTLLLVSFATPCVGLSSGARDLEHLIEGVGCGSPTQHRAGGTKPEHRAQAPARLAPLPPRGDVGPDAAVGSQTAVATRSPLAVWELSNAASAIEECLHVPSAAIDKFGRNNA